MTNISITVQNTVRMPINQVWEKWTLPEHIIKWNNASEDWHTPYAANDLRVGGTFTYKMAAKDGSYSFDFGGIYDEVILNKLIAYTLGDGRKVLIKFIEEADYVKIIETFEAEGTHPLEMQKSGWQAILDNFKTYAESVVE